MLPSTNTRNGPFSRRALMIGAGSVVVGGAVATSGWFNVFADASNGGALTADEAYQMARDGQIFLIDIRRPDEWSRTGVAAPAIPIDMRRDDFETALRAILDRLGERPVALICARGVRSHRMTARLAEAGFSDTLDVPEGMLGSGAGAGYIAQGLPLRAPSDGEMNGTL